MSNSICFHKPREEWKCQRYVKPPHHHVARYTHRNPGGCNFLLLHQKINPATRRTPTFSSPWFEPIKQQNPSWPKLTFHSSATWAEKLESLNPQDNLLYDVENGLVYSSEEKRKRSQTIFERQSSPNDQDISLTFAFVGHLLIGKMPRGWNPPRCFLSPILYTIFTSDLLRTATTNLALYGDDIALWSSELKTRSSCWTSWETVLYILCTCSRQPRMQQIHINNRPISWKKDVWSKQPT